jgi:hypothetical protein
MCLLTKLFTFGFLFALFPLAVNPESMISQPILWIETFDHEQIPKTIGTWEHNVLDSNQGIRIELADQDAANKKNGKSLALHFDVDSSNPAMVGCWIKLENQDISAFDTLHFSLKSQGGRFTGNVAVQFTDSLYRKAAYLVSQVKADWKEYQIPLKRFPRISNWSEIREFEIIIDDINANPKQGTLLIDEIYVSKDKDVA